MQILESVYFGKYYFEVALVLRSSLLLSSLLLNSEAWVNLSDKNIRGLEQTDEILLSRILESEANTSNVFKYLELGILPVRFEIIKRKILFLQYILQQEEESMVYQVFKTTCENSTKNDFVKTCQKYLTTLEINLTFDDIQNMSKWKFKKLVKEKTEIAALKYLTTEKNKQTKIKHINYKKLELQKYLMDGNKNIDTSKFIFKARAKTLELKTQKSWKYDDKICIGCNVREETGNELLTCWYFGKDTLTKPIHYDMVYGESVSDMILVATTMMKQIKKRKTIFDNLLEYGKF